MVAMRCLGALLLTLTCADCAKTPASCTTCGASCSTSADCAAGSVCFGGECVPSSASPNTIALAKPGLIDLDFTGGTLPPGVSFRRSTTATTFAGGGQVDVVPIGAARLERDVKFSAPLGVLVEPASSNICYSSQDMQNNVWWAARTDLTPAPMAAPDGTMSAVFMTPSTMYGYHSMGEGFPGTSGTVYSYSIFLKDAGLGAIFVGVTDSTTYANQRLDLTTGVLSQNNGQNVIAAAGAIPVGDGWYRAWLTFADTGIGTALDVMLETGLDDPDPTHGVYVWGCQLEVSPVPSSYVASTPNPGARAGDELRVDAASTLDLGQDFTLLVVQSVDVAAGSTAVGVSVQPAADTRELTMGVRAAGVGGLAVDDHTALPPVNLGAGPAWRDGELHAIAVAKHGGDYTFVDNGAVAHGTYYGFSGALPAGIIQIGQRQDLTSSPTRVQRFVAWQEALDEATLVTMTRP